MSHHASWFPFGRESDFACAVNSKPFIRPTAVSCKQRGQGHLRKAISSHRVSQLIFKSYFCSLAWTDLYSHVNVFHTRHHFFCCYFSWMWEDDILFLILPTNHWLLLYLCLQMDKAKLSQHRRQWWPEVVCVCESSGRTDRPAVWPDARILPHSGLHHWLPRARPAHCHSGNSTLKQLVDLSDSSLWNEATLTPHILDSFTGHDTFKW